ncbi:MAG: hypothetical protein KKI08_03435, partial [Armatimonadetes bacterium]|nr:hypothetical protein [Armatimonadota bacterium]
PQTSLHAAVLSPQGVPVAFVSQPLAGTAVALRLAVPQANLWFPDCPYVYTLEAVLLRDGRAVDRLRQKIAFRDLRVVETDVMPTLRHAWGWALTDYTFCCNGQPVFPRGTVGGFNRQYPDESAALCRELWLTFERNYGSSVARLSDVQADDMATRGLTLTGSLAPDYTGLRQYVSAASGLEDFREMARRTAWLADHPALLSLQVGNEAELDCWGADLRSSYGDDLWHVFNEVTRVVREEWQPTLPLAYVRAANFNSVLPVPREDYSGVNQYTGRYWGRRATIPADLGELALSSAREHKPIAITEWNGPKYSWATRGVSGVDEEGAAQYIADYYRHMTRTPGLLMSTEFVLNWVVTPVEDLTTVPLAEGLKRRAAWKWALQQGTPWFPQIWPDLLTDTPARRAMRGFSSPLYELTEAPGEIVILADAARQADAARLAEELHALGRAVTTRSLREANLPVLDANMLILGGVGDRQPAAVRELERLRVIGHTDAGFPAAGQFLAQRRVNPWFPDRALVVLTAAEASGMAHGLEALHQSAAGLREALARQASCRRAVALIDDNQEIAKAFSRYVMELPARGFLLGRDDLRTALQADEFLTPEGKLSAQWSDLTALVIAARRPLTDAEREAVAAVGRAGVTVVWSRATLEADSSAAAQLGLTLGATKPLTDPMPVADWAQQPLAVPRMGDIALGPLQEFGGLKPDSEEWQRATTARELTAPAPWR